MEVTYLGHACYLIKINELNILVDPILTNSFQGGTAAVSPACSINVDSLPYIDAVIITHCHPGHLEVDSLALLPNETVVFYPADPTVELVLEGLGFNNRNILKAGQEVEFAGGKFIVTGTTTNVPEIGIVFQEADATCWYLADTNVTPEIIGSVLDDVKTIDFLICNFPGYHHQFFTGSHLSFPINDLSTTLEQVLRVKPKLVAPNFSGLRYLGDASWINRIMFPMSPELFLEEVRKLNTNQQVANLLPGDVVIVSVGSCKIHSRRSEIINLLEEVQLNSFDPMKEIPLLKDPNPENLESKELEFHTQNFLLNELVPWIKNNCDKQGSLLATYKQLGIKFRLTVIYPNELEENWIITLNNQEINCVKLENLKEYSFHFGLRIAASVLDRWHKAEIPYYHVYCYARPYGQIYKTGVASDNSVYAEQVPTRDLVSLYLSGNTETVYHPWLRKQIAKYRGVIA
ncbi:MBL fold metallo-hydrolase [Bacillus paranthracis]|uniref:MBL fold metallo-hydrolase n=1 Tax=Bacillus paranthracis TaxID=2026186 RepID=A0AAJ1K134_9BACI|nr:MULTISPECIES: MBL fold metallo-hydrolase [Bacillus]ADY19593.1 hypothetical protein YBT020_01705 [Bacillus thuringiensis serovar finitimus YBT-020]MCW4574717.1 MBL fold metallo-hydrolase [Bacillus pacificus]MDA1584739.1 MBL fold metallo-hydrolase [Bacillus cereus group sp. TH230-1LC]MRC71169.1 hypothetical protein [Bacillus thuringiensis]OTX74316.1 hypothetical protein BK722_06540 [Bacillus thuringiensis serovar finitimus]